MLVPVNDAVGRIVAMLQMLENLPPPPVSADILRGMAGKCSGIRKYLQTALEDSEHEECLGKVSKGLMKRVVTPEDKPPSDDDREEKPIPSP